VTVPTGRRAAAKSAPPAGVAGPGVRRLRPVAATGRPCVAAVVRCRGRPVAAMPCVRRCPAGR